MTHILSKDLLLSSVTNYFQNHNQNRKILRTIVEGTSPVSLRVVDWFVTHFAKHNNIMYWIRLDGKKYYEHLPEDKSPVRKFQISLEYRAMLRSFSKVHFDPFRRHDRVSFVIETAPQITVIETTLGQLRFWQWALEYHVYDYIINHLTEIEASMAAQANIRRKVAGAVVDELKSTASCQNHPTVNLKPVGKTGTGIDSGTGRGKGRKLQVTPTTIYRMKTSCQLVFD